MRRVVPGTTRSIRRPARTRLRGRVNSGQVNSGRGIVGRACRTVQELAEMPESAAPATRPPNRTSRSPRISSTVTCSPTTNGSGILGFCEQTLAGAGDQVVAAGVDRCAEGCGDHPEVGDPGLHLGEFDPCRWLYCIKLV